MCQTYANMFPAGCDHDDCSGTHTNGGYSSDITVQKCFVFKVPEGTKLEPETEIINAKDAEASLHLLNDGVGGVKRFVIDAATIKDM